MSALNATVKMEPGVSTQSTQQHDALACETNINMLTALNVALQTQNARLQEEVVAMGARDAQTRVARSKRARLGNHALSNGPASSDAHVPQPDADTLSATSSVMMSVPGSSAQSARMDVVRNARVAYKLVPDDLKGLYNATFTCLKSFRNLAHVRLLTPGVMTELDNVIDDDPATGSKFNPNNEHGVRLLERAIEALDKVAQVLPLSIECVYDATNLANGVQSRLLDLQNSLSHAMDKGPCDMDVPVDASSGFGSPVNPSTPVGALPFFDGRAVEGFQAIVGQRKTTPVSDGIFKRQNSVVAIKEQAMTEFVLELYADRSYVVHRTFDLLLGVLHPPMLLVDSTKSVPIYWPLGDFTREVRIMCAEICGHLYTWNACAQRTNVSKYVSQVGLIDMCNFFEDVKSRFKARVDALVEKDSIVYTEPGDYINRTLSFVAQLRAVCDSNDNPYRIHTRALYCRAVMSILGSHLLIAASTYVVCKDLTDVLTLMDKNMRKNAVFEMAETYGKLLNDIHVGVIDYERAVKYWDVFVVQKQLGGVIGFSLGVWKPKDGLMFELLRILALGLRTKFVVLERSPDESGLVLPISGLFVDYERRRGDPSDLPARGQR